jgi:hypothetical protein
MRREHDRAADAVMETVYLHVSDEWFGGLAPMKWRDEEAQRIVARHPIQRIAHRNSKEMVAIEGQIDAMRADLLRRGFALSWTFTYPPDPETMAP